MTISDTIQYVGVNDHEIEFFEGQYPVPHGMAYNSYLILDEKIAVMDSVDGHFTREWLDNLAAALKGRQPDYLIVQHMEPDHSGSILAFLEAYPSAKVAASARAFEMLKNFYGTELGEQALVVGENDTLDLGSRTLTFLTAPMVHWPEVIVTYDAKDKVLFSADAFGKFGALDVEEDWADEARRYYFGIVGKYGAPVQSLLKKVGGLEIQAICSLHGPVLTGRLDYYLGLYDTWSRYLPEEEGIVIAYTSVYGNTAHAVETLAQQLRKEGAPKVVVHNLAECDHALALADAFRYSKLVLATTTYNGSIFPFMRAFLEHLTERGFSNRTVGLIENGSWAPAAAHIMRGILETCKNLSFTPTTVRIRSALNQESTAQLSALANELLGTAPAETAGQAPVKKYICKICGYIHEGSLSADFTCPICRQSADHFEELK